MDDALRLLMPLGDRVDAMLAGVNRRLALGGLSISHEDARMLAERRTELLADTERVEFGTPALALLAEAVSTSPCLSGHSVAHELGELLGAFYTFRDELPTDVPDAEIVEALRGCLDAWGSATEVASLPLEEVMRHSDEYLRATEEASDGEYRITDDEGHTYTFDPAAWDYDEQADGWNGERWADDWSDEQTRC